MSIFKVGYKVNVPHLDIDGIIIKFDDNDNEIVSVADISSILIEGRLDKGPNDDPIILDIHMHNVYISDCEHGWKKIQCLADITFMPDFMNMIQFMLNNPGIALRCFKYMLSLSKEEMGKIGESVVYQTEKSDEIINNAKCATYMKDMIRAMVAIPDGTDVNPEATFTKVNSFYQIKEM